MNEQETKQFFFDMTKIVVEKTMIAGQEYLTPEEQEKWAERVSNMVETLYRATDDKLFNVMTD